MKELENKKISKKYLITSLEEIFQDLLEKDLVKFGLTLDEIGHLEDFDCL